MPRCHAHHRRSERGDCDADVRERAAQAKAVRMHEPPVVVGAFAGHDGSQGFDGLAHARGGVRPVAIVPAGHHHRARRPGATPTRSRSVSPPRRRRSDRDRASDPHGQRADLEREALRRASDRRCQRECVEARQLADPEGFQTGALDLSRDRQRLFSGRSSQKGSTPSTRPLSHPRPEQDALEGERVGPRPQARSPGHSGTARRKPRTSPRAVAACSRSAGSP